jgi:acetylornithine deacetylase/succinyl-diaminopimelate desuccinylase-like protein
VVGGDGAELERFLDRTSGERLAGYKALLAIPSISALPEHANDCVATAEWIADDLRRSGVEHVEVAATSGHPVVYGDWLHAGADAPTAIVYGHYDVQPVDPLEQWQSPPFEPSVHDGRILARGAADDKSQVHMHLRATEAMFATRGGPPVNLRFVFEGDEESSALPLAEWVAANRDRLSADLAVVSDSGFFEGNIPALTIGLRGIMYAQIDVRGTPVDLHSGSFGGAVANPAFALATILAALKGPDGVITVPGFYDDVRPLTEADREAFAALPFDEAAWARAAGVRAPVGEAGYSTLERRGGRPTFEINGMWSGFTGEGSKTIVPAEAHAKISCRLVPDQDPDRIFELVRAEVERLTPPGVEVTMHQIQGGRASLLPIHHPATQAAARALEGTFGRAPVYIREGGSIPVSATFSEVLGLPVVLLGFTQPDDNAHAPNEWMDLANYETGIRAIVRYWDELSAVGRAALGPPTA